MAGFSLAQWLAELVPKAFLDFVCWNVEAYPNTQLSKGPSKSVIKTTSNVSALQVDILGKPCILSTN